MEVEILQAARGEIKKAPLVRRLPCIAGRPARRCKQMTGHSIAAILPHTLDWPRYAKADDPVVAAQIREIVRQRGSYGYRRVIAMVNRAFDTAYNRKRIRRLMEINDWNLPRPGRRRTGRAHTGRIVRGTSNERWSSDTLQIPCWNGDLVKLGFILDCHDREAIAHVAVPRKYRAYDEQELLQAAVTQSFGDSRPVEQLQFLSGNKSIYTALDTVCKAERLGLSPVTTPAYRPQSNGMSEAFVNTLRRDCLAGADRSTATAVLDQVPDLDR